MEHLLDNPVYNALQSVDALHNIGTGNVTYFDERMSPFAGFASENKKGFEELYVQLPPGRNILYASVKKISIPQGWDCMAALEGMQFVREDDGELPQSALVPVLLGEANIPEMLSLTKLTRPGPFSTRTINFGHYYGFFKSGKLAAMSGQRLHLNGLTEISAVCTHPSFLGKGYAGALLSHQIKLIQEDGRTPFLHVRSDNHRAIALYERLGFRVRAPMHFYFLKKA